MPSAGATEQTICTGATYSDTTGATSCTACPAADSSTQITSGYPENWYPDDNLRIIGFWLGDATGISAIENCRANYTGINNRGRFTSAKVIYNSSTSKYDRVIANTYYTKVNPGYYADTTAAGTCPGAMVYQKTLPCPANSYCPGFADGMPLCSDSNYTYGTTLGLNACPTGLLSPAGSWKSSQCGHILHIGDNTLYLHGTKDTTPSLNVRWGDTTWYANMTLADKKMNINSDRYLKIRYDNTTYNVCDDTVCPM